MRTSCSILHYIAPGELILSKWYRSSGIRFCFVPGSRIHRCIQWLSFNSLYCLKPSSCCSKRYTDSIRSFDRIERNKRIKKIQQGTADVRGRAPPAAEVIRWGHDQEGILLPFCQHNHPGGFKQHCT